MLHYGIELTRKGAKVFRFHTRKGVNKWLKKGLLSTFIGGERLITLASNYFVCKAKRLLKRTAEKGTTPKWKNGARIVDNR